MAYILVNTRQPSTRSEVSIRPELLSGLIVHPQYPPASSEHWLGRRRLRCRSAEAAPCALHDAALLLTKKGAKLTQHMLWILLHPSAESTL